MSNNHLANQILYRYIFDSTSSILDIPKCEKLLEIHDKYFSLTYLCFIFYMDLIHPM